jgi:hypothetical protein
MGPDGVFVVRPAVFAATLIRISRTATLIRISPPC